MYEYLDIHDHDKKAGVSCSFNKHNFITTTVSVATYQIYIHNNTSMIFIRVKFPE